MNALFAPSKHIALCFIISNKQVLHHEAEWREWIRPNADIIRVYFHYKHKSSISSAWIREHAIPPGCIQPTSYFFVVPAYLALMFYARRADVRNQWFCMLTETCFPAVSPAVFRAQFEKWGHRTLMRTLPAHWNLTLHNRANLRLLRPAYHLANDPWFVVTRRHVEMFEHFMTSKEHASVRRVVNAGGLANESLFAIMLQTYHEVNGLHHRNVSSTVAEWSVRAPHQNPTSPFLFRDATPDHQHCLLTLLRAHPYALFVRKIHQDFSVQCIQSYWKEHPAHHELQEKEKNRWNRWSRWGFIVLILIILGILSAHKTQHYDTTAT